jgi:hypothetical protein
MASPFAWVPGPMEMVIILVLGILLFCIRIRFDPPV